LSPLRVVRPPTESSSTLFAGQVERMPCCPPIASEAEPKAATDTLDVISAPPVDENSDRVPSYLAEVTTSPRSNPEFGPVPRGWSHSSG
jgi:hypothetical protein